MRLDHREHTFKNDRHKQHKENLKKKPHNKIERFILGYKKINGKKQPQVEYIMHK